MQHVHALTWKHIYVYVSYMTKKRFCNVSCLKLTHILPSRQYMSWSCIGCNVHVVNLYTWQSDMSRNSFGCNIHVGKLYMWQGDMNWSSIGCNLHVGNLYIWQSALLIFFHHVVYHLLPCCLVELSNIPLRHNNIALTHKLVWEIMLCL